MDRDKLSSPTRGTRRDRGFTLVELMITVAIVAILASIAIPAYRDYVRRGAIEEVIAALGSGRVAIEQYFLDNRTYVGAPCPANTRSFAVACALAAGTYTITATGAGNMATFVYTIDQADARTTAGPWGAGNCWVTRKGSTC